MTDTNDQEDFRTILMRHRTVMLSGDINRESTGDVGRRLLRLQMQSTDKINLLIDSGGGENNAAYQLCDLIECVMTAPVRAIVVGACDSAATFVLLHCIERVATPNSRFLIHSSTTSGISLQHNQANQAELEHLLQGCIATSERMFKMYMQKMNKPRDVIEELVRRGDRRFNRSISAAEAVELGLIQSIASKLDIFPAATA